MDTTDSRDKTESQKLAAKEEEEEEIVVEGMEEEAGRRGATAQEQEQQQVYKQEQVQASHDDKQVSKPSPKIGREPEGVAGLGSSLGSGSGSGSDKEKATDGSAAASASDRDLAVSLSLSDLAPFKFPASRQAYAEAKKAEKEAQYTMTYAALARLTAQRASLKARHNRRHSSVAPAATSASRMTAASLFNTNSAPFTVQDQDQEAAMPAYERGATNAPVLLEARVVEEFALVHAEPVHIRAFPQPGAQEEEIDVEFSDESLEEGNILDHHHHHHNHSSHHLKAERRNSTSTVDTDNMVSRRWLYVSAIILVIFLAWIIIFASGLVSPQEEDPQGTTTISDRKQGNLTAVPVTPPFPDAPATNISGPSFLPPSTKQTIAQNERSPQAKALMWVLNHPNYTSLQDWRKRQLMALSTMYYGTGGEITWSVWSTWLNASKHECDWRTDIAFVPNCTQDGRYRDVNLATDRLKGNIPPQLAFLSHLTALDLHGNELSGPLPTQLGQMTKLTSLRLDQNPSLTGSLPTQLGQLTDLQELSLEKDTLVGPIHTELGLLTDLQNLNLYQNRFTGTIPSEVGTMTSLTSIWFEENLLSGLIPTELGLLTALTFLSLNENSLVGSIPSQLGLLTELHELLLYENQLSGQIPADSWTRLSNLESLYIYNTHVRGVIPSTLCHAILRIECDRVECNCGGDDICNCF